MGNSITEMEIKDQIVKRSEEIARILAKDKDCEIRKDRTKGIKVISVDKREVYEKEEANIKG